MLKFVIISLLVAAASPSTLTITRPRLQPGRIIGGIQIEISKAPFMVAFLWRGSQICAASIISDTAALTAAHCSEGRIAIDITLRAGSTYRAAGGDVIQVAQIIEHPAYNPRLLDFDYCVLRTVQSFEFSDYIQKIALPEQYADIEDGTKCTVAGWGVTQNPNESRDALRAVNVTIVDPMACHDAYSSIGGITSRMICAGAESRDACQGDSGGALWAIEGKHNKLLMGIVSWGIGCARPEFPGVYSKVAYVAGWIKAQASIEKDPSMMREPRYE